MSNSTHKPCFDGTGLHLVPMCADGTMEQREAGASGFKISTLGFGCWQYVPSALAVQCACFLWVGGRSLFITTPGKRSNIARVWRELFLWVGG